MAKIIIEVPKNPDSPTVVGVKGYKGEGCKAITEGIEAALGAKVSDKETEEFYERATEKNPLRE